MPVKLRKSSEPGSPDLAARALWAALVALALLRISALSAPGMWLWSRNSGRFLPPWIAWSLEFALLASLLPPIARVVVRGLNAIGDRLARSDRGVMLVAMGVAFSIVWLLPDQVHFTGDALLRRTSASQSGPPLDPFSSSTPARSRVAQSPSTIPRFAPNTVDLTRIAAPRSA